MSNYMSQYEEYYKNINKRNNDEKNSKYLPNRKRNDKHIYSLPMSDGEPVAFFSQDYWRKRIIRDVSGAMILLILFAGMKYVKNDYTQQAYIWTRGLITSNFNYDETIDYFSRCQVGGYKVNEINVGGVTVQDLKSDKISIKVNNLINYIKNKMVIER